MFARRLALAIALIAGIIGTQGPEFAQQYRQRIGGALDELKRIVAEFDAEAAAERLTPTEAITRLEENGDPLARQRGADIARTIERARPLQEQLNAMAAAGPLERLHHEIARRTLDNFEPATPLSLEALTAGGLAAFWGWAATHLVAWPFGRRRALGRGRRRAAEA